MTDTDNLSRRRFLQATGGAASAAALAGCIGGDESDSDNQQSDKTLQMINSTVSTLDPVKSTDTAGGRVIQQIFDPLINYPNGETDVENLLVESYDVSDDQTTYTFHLKEGVQFHGDHGEVTADDVVYSWRRLAESENSRRTYFILSSVGVEHESTTITYTGDDGEEHEMSAAKPDSLALNVVDDYTLEMTLQEPFHSTLEVLAYTSFAVIPEGIIGDIEGYDGDVEHSKFATEEPIGCGPFEFDSWSSNNEVSVARFDDYHGDVAKVAGVHWNISSDEDAIYTYGVVNQNADMVVGNQLPTGKYDPKKVTIEETDERGRKIGTYGETQSGATMRYEGVATINSFYMGFNTNAVEKPVRQAAAYAVNQDEVIKQVFKGRGESSYHFTPPSIYPGGATEYESHAEEGYPYGYNKEQLDEAQKVMEEAGYGDDNRASFTFTVYESSNTWADFGTLLQDKLASVYIDMEVERAPFATLLERGRSGNLEAYSLGWVMDWPAPDNFLQLLNPPQTDTSLSSPISYTNWSDTDAASQAEEAWATIQDNTGPTDEAQQARNEAYVQMEEANWEDVVFLPAYHRNDERFSYDWVDAPKFGGGGTSRQKLNKVEVGDRE